jgi:pyruvate/2-oxoglutarate dehydrogenase complex dihydrolipoamide dehydrogenase (E3) component
MRGAVERKVVGLSRMKRAEADEILFALGRLPNTAGLGLENTGKV